MEQIYINTIIFMVLFAIVVWINYKTPRHENFKLFNFNDYGQYPYLRLPPINYYSNIPTGYDSGTRDYNNPFFAQQVAQGLETN